MFKILEYSDLGGAEILQVRFPKINKEIDDVMQKEKGLLPNVDFYSATVYYSMGIPIDIFTPIREEFLPSAPRT